jgi:hypothetical protein
MVLSTRDSWDARRSVGLPPRVRCLTKPLSAQTMLAETREFLQELAHEPRAAGLSFFGLLQLLVREHKTCMLQVAAGERTGSLHILSGEIVHASTPACEGEAALLEMLGWVVPRVRLTPALPELRLTIDTPAEQLLASAGPFQHPQPLQGLACPEPADEPKWRPRPSKPGYEASPAGEWGGLKAL